LKEVAMPTGVLVLLALVSPFVSALLLRYLRTRLTAVPFYTIGTLLFAIAGGALIMLALGNIERLQLGSIILVQPQGVDLSHPVEQIQPGAATGATPAPLPTQAAPTATAAATATRRAATPTAAATATPSPSPTATAEPTATATSTPAPTATPEPQATVRRYAVQPGDTLRSIADTFGVTVQQIINANDFSAEDADSIQPGDTLIIP
jgi:LysM repeat protein